MAVDDHVCSKCRAAFRYDFGGLDKQPEVSPLCAKCNRALWTIATQQCGFAKEWLAYPDVPCVACRRGIDNPKWLALLDEFFAVEISCNICGKKNDSNVRVCYSCGNPPTMAKYKSTYDWQQDEGYSAWK